MRRGDHRAFPGRAFDEDGQEWIHPGMTIREYFAAKALQGLLANPRLPDSKKLEPNVAVAKMARSFADGLLAEIERGEGS